MCVCVYRLAYGLDNGIVIVDFVQKCVLLNISTADMYGSADPYQRAPRSPKRTTALSETSDGERCRSPSIDQVTILLLRFDFLVHTMFIIILYCLYIINDQNVHFRRRRTVDNNNTSPVTESSECLPRCV